jgi:hypothetical protein
MTDHDFHDFQNQVLTAIGDLKASQAQEVGDLKAEMIESLGTLKSEMATATMGIKAIVDRQDITNGRIDTQERKTGDMLIELAERRNSCPLASHVEKDLIEHIDKCPLKGRITIIEEFVSNVKAKTDTNAHWMTRLWPVIYASAGVLFYLVLANADSVLKAISLKHHIG